MPSEGEVLTRRSSEVRTSMLSDVRTWMIREVMTMLRRRNESMRQMRSEVVTNKGAAKTRQERKAASDDRGGGTCCPGGASDERRRRSAGASGEPSWSAGANGRQLKHRCVCRFCLHYCIVCVCVYARLVQCWHEPWGRKYVNRIARVTSSPPADRRECCVGPVELRYPLQGPLASD